MFALSNYSCGNRLDQSLNSELFLIQLLTFSHWLMMPEISNLDATITLAVMSTVLTQRACQLVKVSYFLGIQHRFDSSLVNE